MTSGAAAATDEPVPPLHAGSITPSVSPAPAIVVSSRNVRRVSADVACGRGTQSKEFAMRRKYMLNSSIGQTPADDRLTDDSPESLRSALRQPTPERVYQLKRAMQAGVSLADLNELTTWVPTLLLMVTE